MTTRIMRDKNTNFNEWFSNDKLEWIIYKNSHELTVGHMMSRESSQQISNRPLRIWRKSVK